MHPLHDRLEEKDEYYFQQNMDFSKCFSFHKSDAFLHWTFENVPPLPVPLFFFAFQFACTPIYHTISKVFSGKQEYVLYQMEI